MRSCPTCRSLKQSDIDVTIGASGFNPYRTTQFAYNDTWKKAGMSKVAGDAISARSRTASTARTWFSTCACRRTRNISRSCSTRRSRASWRARSTRKQTVKAVLDGWNDLNEQIGVESQLKFYKGTLGIQR